MWLSILLFAAAIIIYLIVHSHDNVPPDGRVLDGGRRFIMPRDSSGSSCAIQVSGHDALAYFVSQRVNVSAACRATEELQARSGTLWVTANNQVGQALEPAGATAYSKISGDTLICRLYSGNGVELVVWDSGGATYGSQLCTGFVSVGWKEG
jgi:hypothetical protein